MAAESFHLRSILLRLVAQRVGAPGAQHIDEGLVFLGWHIQRHRKRGTNRFASPIIGRVQRFAGSPGTQSPVRRTSTWWWFLIPLLTCGVGSFVMVLIGGLRLKSRWNIAASVGYFLLTAYFFIGVQYTPPDGKLPDAAVMPAFLIMWFGGLAHVVILQTVISGTFRAAPDAEPIMSQDPALAAALWRAQRRQEARAILSSNAALALELRIGRPDLPREYNDGGLVDVNHVPVQLLSTALTLSPQAAATIVAQRDRIGGFSSPEELVVYCEDVTIDQLQLIRDRLVFFRY